MKVEKIYTLHEENKDWANRLLFYKDEIRILENRLGEVASKNTSKDVLTPLEHFQNQLIVQRSNIDTLNHSINLDEDCIGKEIKKNGVALQHRSIEDHTGIRDNIGSFEKNFRTLKTELNDFLSKWM